MRTGVTVVACLLSCKAFAMDAMQQVGEFWIDRTEVSVAAFARFAEATGFVSEADVRGGGEVYGFGWEPKPGWVWVRALGRLLTLKEPAVHLTFDEAAQYCQWRGARLPTDFEWMKAYTRQERIRQRRLRQEGVSIRPVDSPLVQLFRRLRCRRASGLCRSVDAWTGSGTRWNFKGRCEWTLRYGCQRMGVGGWGVDTTADHPRWELVVWGRADASR